MLDGEKAAEQKIDSMRLRIKYMEYLRELGITEQRTENIPVDVLVSGVMKFLIVCRLIRLSDIQNSCLENTLKQIK